MGSKPRVLVCLGIILALAGCANQNSIFRKNIAGGASPVVITVDAKQRHLLVVPGQDQEGGWKVCAEAAPDVFSALSTSAAADLGLGRSGTQTDAQAKAALAIAEAAGTIERTQTINLLRESMYRTCERYLSGAIDRSAFVVQAGRDWRAMIAILAIEQLTRVARPPSTVIAAGSTTANVQSESDAIRQLIIAQSLEEDALSAKQRADADLASTDCADEANKSVCEQKQKTAAAAADALAVATRKRETWEAVAKSYGQSLNSGAATGAGTVSGGGYTSPGTPADMTDVATKIDNIVARAFATDETQLFCIEAVSRGFNMALTDKCMEYLIQKVESDRQGLFGAPAVVTRATDIRSDMRNVRARTIDFLWGLDDQTYMKERSLIAAQLGAFCEGLNRLSCISDIQSGSTDPVAKQLAPIIDERIRARGKP